MTRVVSLIAAAAVQQPLLRGRQPVAGLWFDATRLAEPQRVARLLAQWQPGSRALRFADGDLLLWPAPVLALCESLPGAPLVRQGGWLCSAELSEAEQAALPRGAGELVIVAGGQPLQRDLARGVPLDLSIWLATDHLTWQEALDCREALPPEVELAPADARALRDVLDGRVPPASEAQRDFLRQMAGRPGADKAAGKATGKTSGRTGWQVAGGISRRAGQVMMAIGAVVVIILLAGVLLGLGESPSSGSTMRGGVWAVLIAIWLIQWWRHSRPGGAMSIDATPRGAAPGHAAPPTLPARQPGVHPQAWRRWMTRLALTTQISRLVGLRQAAYLRRMLAMFEEGKLDDALRHAIPLGDGQGGSLGQAFGAPSARGDLSLKGARQASTSIHLGDALNGHLRQLYRKSFEQLDRQGRIDEAVFVLAELLGARQEALDYLEVHERYRQAAELALGWDQPAEVIVRLHALAGDWQRALAVAQRDNAFQSAVLQLEKRWPDAAVRLRLAWAETLVARGEWLQAVDVVWPLPAQRAQAAEWLRAAEAAGGVLGARALVQRAVLLPDTLATETARLRTLQQDIARHGERAAVAQALLALKDAASRPALGPLARAVVPGLLADLGAGRGHLPQSDLERLMGVAGDAWLQADLPRSGWPRTQQRPLRQEKMPMQTTMPEGGGLPLLDAVPLPDQRYLVALGEAGAAVLDAQGRVLHRHAVPAQRLVIAHSGQVALALARRQGLWRVSRLDLAQRRSLDLGQGDFTHMASEFDGVAWTVAGGCRLRVLDTRSSLRDVLWQVGDLPGNVRGMSSTPQAEQLLLDNPAHGPEIWRYVLPQRRLAVRGEPLPELRGADALRLLNPQGGLFELWLDDVAPSPGQPTVRAFQYRINGQQRALDWPLPSAAAVPDGALIDATMAWLQRGWLVIVLPEDDDASTSAQGRGVQWLLVALDTGQVKACVKGGAPASDHDAPGARVLDPHVVLFDAEGRLWHVDTGTSEVRAFTVRG